MTIMHSPALAGSVFPSGVGLVPLHFGKSDIGSQRNAVLELQSEPGINQQRFAVHGHGIGQRPVAVNRQLDRAVW
jgi:hypothetical protein